MVYTKTSKGSPIQFPFRHFIMRNLELSEHLQDYIPRIYQNQQGHTEEGKENADQQGWFHSTVSALETASNCLFFLKSGILSSMTQEI